MATPRRSWRALDYVDVLYRLLFPVGEYRPAKASRVAALLAQRLGVSRATVAGMLQRLIEQGLVERGPDRALALTPAGIALAESGVRATRVIERFLVDMLGYEPGDVHQRSLSMRYVFDPEMVDRLHESLGAPKRCPHGWPIGAVDERVEGHRLRRLIELSAGARCRIVSVSEHDPALVRWVFDAGLVPGTVLSIRESHSAAGLMTVSLAANDEVSIGDKAAHHVFVDAVA